MFADLGAGILKNAWEGFNASLFAYGNYGVFMNNLSSLFFYAFLNLGQTGSGKSYSVVGYGTNKGKLVWSLVLV